MSVLVRGMEMPKNCWECSLSDVDDDYGRCCLFSGIACLNIGRQDNCPLVEVPPHGDLIDRDNLLEKAYYDYNETTHDYNKFRVVFEDDIIDAPVIIEGNVDGSEVRE